MTAAEDAVPDITPGAATTLHGHLFGLARVAVVVTDEHGRVSHWSLSAQDLFGLHFSEAIGYELDHILAFDSAPRDIFDLRDGQVERPWTGIWSVSRPLRRRTGAGSGPPEPTGIGGPDEPIETALWVFPLTEGRSRILVLAADARRLRQAGPGLALGDHILIQPPDGERAPDPGFSILAIEPTTVQVPRDRLLILRGNIIEILPRMGPETSECVADEVLGMGYPALDITLSTRLAFAPYGGRAGRVRGTSGRLEIGPGRHAKVREAREGEETDEGEADGTVLELAAARERLAFLNWASTQIGTSLDLSQTADELTGVLVPQFADFAGVQLLDHVLDNGNISPVSPDTSAVLRRISVVHDDEPGRWDDVVPVGEVLRLPPDTPFAQSMITGEPICVSRVDDTTAEVIAGQFDNRDLRPLVRGRSLLIVPLIARGHSVLGNFVLLRRPDRPAFDEIDIATAEELARSAALSMDNAFIYRREAQTADTLQRSMLPDVPPRLAGVEVSYRYLPGSRNAQVGGDWFDAVRLPGGRVALVVGDVMGHGITSAAVMGQFRTSVRTLAALGLPPDQILRQLDDLAQRLGDTYLATCVYAVYDPVTRRCEAANAGHIPPVLIDPEGNARLLALPSGAPIGVGGVPFEPLRFDLDDGSQLVFCTDGLVEVRGRDIGLGLARLCAELAGPSLPLDDSCEAVIHALHTEDRQDDVALLIARFKGLPPDSIASCDPSSPNEVRQARSFTRATLERWELCELTDTVELLVGELVSNSVRHADGPVHVRLMRADTLVCEVTDRMAGLPSLRETQGLPEDGWGLHLVSGLAERWGTNHTATGKVVWFEYPLPGGE